MNASFDPSEYLQNAFAAEGIALSAEQNAAFLLYADLLEKKNAVMNLTAITDFKDVVHKHFLDSCAAARLPWFPPEGKEISLIDVGSGAGFPGIPLKILYPELKVTLLDSLQKRVNFLNEVIEALRLNGIRAVHARAEDGARQQDLRERFDVAVSRAVAALSVLAEYCLPYVKIGGSFLSYKGSGAEAETEAARGAVRRLGGEIAELTVFELPGADGEKLGRSLIRIAKTAATPKKYPRKAGTASKSPLT